MVLSFDTELSGPEIYPDPLFLEDGHERPPLDPYDVAYLCGGSGRLLTLYLFELLQGNFLEYKVIKRKWGGIDRFVETTENLPPTKNLSDIHKALLKWFAKPQTPGDTYQFEFPQQLKLQCIDYRNSLLKEGLITGQVLPENERKVYGWTVAIGIALVLPSLVFDRSPSFSVEKRVAVLFFWSLLCSILGGPLVRVTRVHLSRKGRRIVKNLETEFIHLKNGAHPNNVRAQRHSQPLAIAIFGLSAMSQYSFYGFFKDLILDRPVYGKDKGEAAEAE
jgi:uncharacterized protein (TIGR04222 family)